MTPNGVENINGILHRRSSCGVVTQLSPEEMTSIIEEYADWMEKARARLDQLERYQGDLRVIANHTPCTVPDDLYSVFTQKPNKKWFTWIPTIKR